MEESIKAKEANELCKIASAMLEAEDNVKEMESVRKRFDNVNDMCFVPKFIAVSDKVITSIKEFGSVRIDKEFEESPSNFHVTCTKARSVSLAWID